jgi:1-acyl-sn-glycerol-3-phosphate acyltransferase
MTGEKLHQGNILVKVGQPFHLPEKREDQSKEQYDQDTMDYIMRSIAAMLPEKYRGVYA